MTILSYTKSGYAINETIIEENIKEATIQIMDILKSNRLTFKEAKDVLDRATELIEYEAVIGRE